MGAFDTVEQRQAIYDRYASSLSDLVRDTAVHDAAHPDCDARPLCVVSAQELAVLLAASPSAGLLYITVAVAELRKALATIEDLQRQVVVVRNLTARTARDAASLVTENEVLIARVDDLEHGRTSEEVVLP